MQNYNNNFYYGHQAQFYDPSAFQASFNHQPPVPLVNYDVQQFQGGYGMAPAPIPVYYPQFDAGFGVAPPPQLPLQQSQTDMDPNGEPDWFNNLATYEPVTFNQDAQLPHRDIPSTSSAVLPTHPIQNPLPTPVAAPATLPQVLPPAVDPAIHTASSDVFFNSSMPPFNCSLMHPQISVDLKNKELWQQFDKIGNEMKVTNKGKKLFPHLAYTVSGLKRGAHYKFILKMIRVFPHALKWNSKEQCFKADIERGAGKLYSNMISTEIKTGEEWEEEGINFEKINIHNIGDPNKNKNVKNAERTIDIDEKKAQKANKKKENKEKVEKICLTLNCRYQPVLTVIEVSEQNGVPMCIMRGETTFEETIFTCVADYRNQKVNTLKTAHNPSCSTQNMENAKKTLEEQSSGVTSPKIGKDRKRKAQQGNVGVKKRRNSGVDSGYSSQSSNVSSTVPTPSGTPPLAYSQYYGWDGSGPSTSG